MPAIARSEPFRNQACPLGVCDGSGWILGEDDTARECECRPARLRRGKSRGVASTLPPKFRGVSFDRPPVTELPRDAVESVRRYISNLDENLAAGKGLWFLGDVGTGKTTLAMLISKAALERGHSVAIYSMPKLLARIRKTYEAGPGEDSYSQFFARLTSVDLLHLDDLGAERQTDWVIEQLYAIVNERYEAQRSIICTANSAQIEEDTSQRSARRAKPEMVVERQIGERTFSRLAEMCGPDPVLLMGEDQRSRVTKPVSAVDLAPVETRRAVGE
jgi:DNA replication protein DnaC